MTRLIRLLAVSGAAAALAACALISTPDPVQLYRFGPTELPSGTAPAASVNVGLRPVRFTEATSQDRLLGVTGTEAAYIAGARWVSPAQQLYTDALRAAFENQAQRVNLIGRGERTRTTLVLDIDVTVFEARYAYAGAAPTATIVARVRLLNPETRSVQAEQAFTIEEAAGENRVSAIVQAFDRGVGDLNTQIVTWTDQNAQ